MHFRPSVQASAFYNGPDRACALSPSACLNMPPQRPLIRLLSRSAAALLAACAAISHAAAPAGPTPLAGPVRASIEQFLRGQTQGLPGKVRLRIDTPASGPLPPCAAPAPFVPTGATLWGRGFVGVRCNAETPWTRFVPVHVSVDGSYYVASRSIEAGQPLADTDFQRRDGDLTALPRSVITSDSALRGVVAVNRIAAGAPLRKELLRGVVVIQQNQNVNLRIQGDGFVVSTAGRAMTRAATGDPVPVKLPDGRQIRGVAQTDGSVELPR